MDSWLPIVLVHEEDPDFNGCPFDELYHNTPEDLINQGLYKKIAISCKPGSLRRVSLSLIAKALGAVPVLTRFEEIVHSPSRALDSARRSMKTGAAEMRSKMRSSSGSITSPEGSSSVSTLAGQRKKIDEDRSGGDALENALLIWLDYVSRRVQLGLNSRVQLGLNSAGRRFIFCAPLAVRLNATWKSLSLERFGV